MPRVYFSLMWWRSQRIICQELLLKRTQLRTADNLLTLRMDKRHKMLLSCNPVLSCSVFSSPVLCCPLFSCLVVSSLVNSCPLLSVLSSAVRTHLSKHEIIFERNNAAPRTGMLYLRTWIQLTWTILTLQTFLFCSRQFRRCNTRTVHVRGRQIIGPTLRSVHSLTRT